MGMRVFQTSGLLETLEPILKNTLINCVNNEDFTNIKIHPGVEALHGPVVSLQPGEAVDEVGAEGRVNVLRGELAPVRPVVSPGAPIAHNLRSNEKFGYLRSKALSVCLFWIGVFWLCFGQMSCQLFAMRGNWGCELEGGCVNIDVKCRACRGGADFRIVETYRIQTFNISISLYGLRGWLDKTASLFNSGGTNQSPQECIVV